jgi:hypothetical protein
LKFFPKADSWQTFSQEPFVSILCLT